MKVGRNRRNRAFFAAVLLAGAGLAACGAPESASGPGKKASNALPFLATGRPEMRVFARRIPWIGTVEPRASVEVTAPADGRIEAVRVADQSRVEKGQPLMRLGGPRVDAQRARLKSGVESLRAELALARQTVDRLDASLKAHLATRDQAAAARAAQLALEAKLRGAVLDRETFEKTVRMAAPMSGTFTGRRVAAGQEVRAGQVLAEIVGAGRLRVVASLFPPQGAALRGASATVRSEGAGPVTGVVRSVVPRAGATGAAIVWIEGPEIDRRLRAGQAVAGSVVLGKRPAAPAVPSAAVVYDEQERPIVFVRTKGTYAARRVRLGLAQDGWVEVVSGLKPDESVVTRGAYELFSRRFREQFHVQD